MTRSAAVMLQQQHGRLGTQKIEISNISRYYSSSTLRRRVIARGYDIMTAQQ
jgi:hypothetical protein